MKRLPERWRRIVAIDPGSASGALAIGDPHGLLSVEKLPENLEDLANRIQVLSHDDTLFVVENVGYGRPGDGIKAMNTFVKHRGHLEAIFNRCKTRVHWVTANVWMVDVLGDLKPKPTEEQLVLLTTGDLQTIDRINEELKVRRKAVIHSVTTKKFPNFSIYKYQADAVGLFIYGHKHRHFLKAE